jgi:hypothetical protein
MTIVIVGTGLMAEVPITLGVDIFRSSRSGTTGTHKYWRLLGGLMAGPLTYSARHMGSEEVSLCFPSRIKCSS